MPKVRRSQEDREIIRENILDEALALISEHGFAVFSMRKLASRLGMTATTIYHYYASKDELYLMILTKGFDMLYQHLEEMYETCDDPALRIRKMVRAYINFGIHKANYYNIMFTSDAPKYRDYIGTEIEPVAYFEKQTALKLADITSQALRDLDRDMGRFTPEEVRYLVIRLWSTLHGIIALYNSRVLQEVDENAAAVIEQVANDLVEQILSGESTYSGTGSPTVLESSGRR
jgi:AcrR family transcriptional regulator